MSKHQRKEKRSQSEIKRFFATKMQWLTEHCANPDITDAEFRHLFALVVRWLFNDDDFCAPSDEELGASCSKGDRQSRRITASLVAKGAITKAKRIGTSFYGFVGLTIRPFQVKQPQDNSAISVQGEREMAGPFGHLVSGLYRIPSTSPSTSPSTLYKHEEVFSQKEEEGLQGEQVEEPRQEPEIIPTTEGDFELFWVAYPNRVNKPAARRAFAIAIQTVDLDTILAGVQRYADTKPAGTSWMNPATFLRNEGWNDERGPMRDERSGLRVALDKLGGPVGVGTLDEFLGMCEQKRQIKGDLK
jgi:hypothetical protein